MARVAVQFIANSNMGSVSKDIARINAQLAALGAEMAALGAANKNTAREIGDVFDSQVGKIRGYETATMSARTITSQLTEDIARQKVQMRDLAKVRKNVGQMAVEQLRLQDATIMPTGRDLATGRVMGKMAVSTDEYTNSIRRAHMEAGILGRALESAGQQGVNAGKRLQWTGRQLTAGLTAPIIAVAAVSAHSAYEIDDAMVRLTKVYGDLAGTSEEELGRVRDATMETAKTVAEQYGIAGKATVELAADLAAAGYQGEELQATTREIQRISLLGQLDQQKAMDATRTIQTVFGHSTEELANKFNFLNAVENQTNTTLQDLTEVIPRTASVIKDLGGTLEDSAVFTVAFKEAGIDAVMGANALRSSLGAIVAPSGVASKKLRALGIDMAELVEQHRPENGGSLMSLLQALGQEMADLGSVERQQAMSILFGRYQFNKMGGLLKGLSENANDASTQVGRAMQLSGASIEELREVADREIAAIQESLSGRLRRAAATIGITFAEIGRPILAMVVSLVEGFANVLQVINQFPGVIKGMVGAFALILALSGPFMFFAGIFRVLISQFTKMRGGLMAARAGVNELLSTQEAFQKHAANAVIPTIKMQEDATYRLGKAVEYTAARMKAMLAENAAGLSGASAGTLAGSARHPAGTVINGQKVGGRFKTAAPPTPAITSTTPVGTSSFVIPPSAVTNAKALTTETDKAGKTASALRGHWSGIASGILLAGSSLALLTGSGGTLSTVLMTSLLTLSLFPTLFDRIGAKVADIARTKFGGKLASDVGLVRGAVDGLTAAFKRTAIGAKLAARVARLGWMSVLGPIGLVIAAVAAAIGIFKAYNASLERTRKKQEAVDNAARTMASTIGFEYKPQGQQHDLIDPKTGETIKTITEKTKEWSEANKDAAKGLKEMNDEQLIREAMEIGIDARKAGASAAQAMEAVEIALRAGRGALADDLMLKIDVKMGDMDAVDDLQRKLQKLKLTDVLNNTGFDTGAMEWVKRRLNNDEGMNTAAKQAARGIGKSFGEGLKGTPQEIQADFRDFQKMLAENVIETSEELQNLSKEQQDALRKAGIDPTNSEAVLKYLNQFDGDNVRKGVEDITTASAQLDRSLHGLNGSLGVTREREYELTQGFLAAQGVPAEQAREIKTLDEAFQRLRLGVITTKEANAGWQQEIEKSLQSNRDMGEVEKLAILNKWRLKAGLEAATDSAQGFGDAIAVAADNTRDAAIAAERAAISASDFVNSFRSNISNNMSEAVGIMMEDYDAATESMQSAIEDESDAWKDRQDERKRLSDQAFNDRKKKLDAAQDAEMQRLEERQQAAVDAVQGELDKAKELDDQRQKMFEAELTRIQRLADAANRNIDFNIALKSGNLDEAARISEAAYVESVKNGIDDARAGLDSAADARDKAGQAKINALEARFPGEKAALEARHEVAQAALEEDKRIADERFEYEQRIHEKSIANRKKTLEAERKILRESLARELEDRLRVIPATQPEYEKNFGWMKGKYEELTGKVLTETDRWIQLHQSGFSTAFDNTKRELGDQATWAAIGKQSIEGLTDGMLGMSLKDFAKWMESGVLPENKAVTSDVKPLSTNRPKSSGMPGTFTSTPTPTTYRRQFVQHGGGPVGTDGGRAGRPRNAPLYPDEVETVLQRGEYVVQKDAVNKIGKPTLDAINAGQTSFFHSGGLVGAVGARVMSTFQQAMGAAIQTGARRKATELASAGDMQNIPEPLLAAAFAAGAGKYGTMEFSDEQLRNAATIIGVGRSMGATERDLVIALMSAIQESMLRNIDHRDLGAVGLFGQRTSEGWGTIAQIADPLYSSRKFFGELLKLKDREKMTMTQVAEAVRGTGLPASYASLQDEARAILAATAAGAETTGLVAGGPQHRGSGTFRLGAGTVTGDIQGLQVEFLNRLARWSAAVGQPYNVGSGFRSMEEQQYLYNRWLARVPGQAPAAPPGRSNHNFGLAADGPRWGNKNPGAFGLTYPMSYEPWHVEPIGAKGMRVPQLAVGGHVNYDNTIANLHKNETVLTAPLSDKLAKGIDRLDSGGTVQYNINVNGANANPDQIADRVLQKIQRIEQTRGPKRVIN